MKFAFILPNLAGGGAEKALGKLARGLIDRGHDVHLVLLAAGGAQTPPDGCTVHTLGARLARGAFGKWRMALQLRWLFERLRREGEGDFDLIVSSLPFADEIARRARLPRHWCRIANTLSAEIGRLADTDGRKADRRRRRYASMYGTANLIAVSDGVASDLRQRLGYAAARIERIYNPFDLAKLRARSRDAAALPTVPYLVHAGRFAAQKRHDLLLAAYRGASLAQRLVLLADPEPALTALIAAHGLTERVDVVGFQANPYPWFAGADLLVLCSDHEGLPNVLIEALACGTRVLSTDCPSGPREILRGGLGRQLVPCGDVDALTAGLQRTLAEPRPPLAEVDAALAPFAAEAVLTRYEALAAAR